MRKCLLVSAALALAAGLSLVSISVQATPTPVDLSGCGGLTSCTSGGVTFTGWQFSGVAWGSANLTYKADPNNETGLGVACTGGKCTDTEIEATPPELIAADLSGINFSSLSLGVGSVDCNGNCSATDEIAYIYGSTCADPGLCSGSYLDSYPGANYPNNAHTFNFSAGDLAGYGFLWVTPGSGNTADILLASLSYTAVPEPAVLGMFGLGGLLIGLFAGLRRRFD